jgi:hypothetical protein
LYEGDSWQLAVSGRQSAVSGRQSAVSGRQSAVSGRQSAVRNPRKSAFYKSEITTKPPTKPSNIKYSEYHLSTSLKRFNFVAKVF